MKRRKSERSEQKVCERCGGPGRLHYRYCKECHKTALLEMEEAGYLERRPGRQQFRPKEKQQDTAKEPSPWTEDAIRALEDR